MKIAGCEKLSLQDYPHHMSAILFTQGCNLKCPFCQNSSLIPMDAKEHLSEEEILNYLESRKKMLDGVTISGGEPTLQPDLVDFTRKIKEMGYDVKLDTNGTNPKLLKTLMDEGLVDYVAMDIKNVPSKYDETSGVKKLKYESIQKSMDLLMNGNVDYEFRTTIIKGYHTIQDIFEIIKVIGNSKYYLQNFKMSADVIDKNLEEFSEDQLNLWNELLKGYSNVWIRGLEKKENK